MGPWHLSFKVSFPPNFQPEGLARRPRRSWDRCLRPQGRLGRTNPPLKCRTGTPGATCCFAGSRALEEMHPARPGFASRGSVCLWNCGSTSVASGLGLAPHLRSRAAPCDLRRGASPRRPEAPEQPGVPVPGRRLQQCLGAWRCRGGTRAERCQRALSGGRRPGAGRPGAGTGS